VCKYLDAYTCICECVCVRCVCVFVDRGVRRAHTSGALQVKWTQEKVIVTKKKVGDLVNLETDIVGKYIVNYLR
jgi:riboflavin synthase alpha subunit